MAWQHIAFAVGIVRVLGPSYAIDALAITQEDRLLRPLSLCGAPYFNITICATYGKLESWQWARRAGVAGAGECEGADCGSRIRHEACAVHIHGCNYSDSAFKYVLSFCALKSLQLQRFWIAGLRIFQWIDSKVQWRVEAARTSRSARYPVGRVGQGLTLGCLGFG